MFIILFLKNVLKAVKLKYHSIKVSNIVLSFGMNGDKNSYND